MELGIELIHFLGLECGIELNPEGGIGFNSGVLYSSSRNIFLVVVFLIERPTATTI